jgi:hypothetical protein
MKRYLAWFAAAVVGAAVGASVVGSLYMRAFRVAIPSTLQQMENEQRYRCVLSMAVLDRLETNQPDRAKLLLVREVASYYNRPLGLADSAEREKVLEHIDSLRAKSNTLNEELIKKAQ